MPKDSAVDIVHQTASAYPGSQASVRDILSLAHSYRDAAQTLFEDCKGTGTLAQAPARLCAIHAVELFLNAYLRHVGEPPEKVRAKLHALSDDAFAEALDLRDRTRRHLGWMTENREYLIVRYGPELFDKQSQVNRVEATMNKVAKKTALFFEL
jgi:hypothetical protein